MQLTRVDITNFKVLRKFSHSFVREWDNKVRPLTLLLGTNGSGKTTILQAIALTLSLASRKPFEWSGFLSRRMATHGPTRVELDVSFDAEELAATRRLYEHWARRVRPEQARAVSPPGQAESVTLIYENGALESPQGAEAISQFLGRFFVKTVVKTEPAMRSQFAEVGDVFWFDQHRNLNSIDDLREYLVRWWGVHTTPGVSDASDFLSRLEKYLQILFPGTEFIGIDLPQGEFALDEITSYVLLRRAGLAYDISEMSSGEQAVFPILYEFARQNIARSLVLIDELELHLHPPEQQILIAALSRIGSNCQFIVTSHSPYLEEVTPDDDEIRLEGGCL